MTLQEKLEDLLVQATKERSHYYVASVVREVLAVLVEKDKQIKSREEESNRWCRIARERQKEVAALKEQYSQLVETATNYSHMLDQERIKTEDQVKQISSLKSWKREMLSVEATWDCQKIGKEIGAKLGASIRAAILPWVLDTKKWIAALRAESDLWKLRAVVVAAHLDVETMSTDIKKWVDEYKQTQDALKTEMDALKMYHDSTIGIESAREKRIKRLREALVGIATHITGEAGDGDDMKREAAEALEVTNEPK